MKNLIFVLGIIVFISCEKEKRNDIIMKQNLTIMAGVQSDDIKYFDFNPDIIVRYQETSCLYYYGNDSIDMDTDSKCDYKINYYMKIPDLNYTCGCNGDCFPSGYQIVEMVRKNKNYQIAIDSGKIIHQFSLNEKISSNNQWDTSATCYFAYTVFPEWTNKWLRVDNKYIGIRLLGQDTIYGWIRVSYLDTIVIKDYGIQIKI
jgi:hypothetical protein